MTLMSYIFIGECFPKQDTVDEPSVFPVVDSLTYLPRQHLVEEYPTAPPISRITIGFSPQYLWSHVLGCTGQCVGPLSPVQTLCTAKVGQNDMSLLGQHTVLRFQISVSGIE